MIINTLKQWILNIAEIIWETLNLHLSIWNNKNIWKTWKNKKHEYDFLKKAFGKDQVIKPDYNLHDLGKKTAYR